MQLRFKVSELFRFVCCVAVGVLIGVQFTVFYNNRQEQCHSACESNTADRSCSDGNSGCASCVPKTDGLGSDGHVYEIDSTSGDKKDTAVRLDDPKSAGELYITAEYNGRLGNLMFQLASAYGIAKTVGKR